MKIEDLEKAIQDGLVSKRKHPVHPLYILNYTAATQFEWNWNDVTLNCRGLVIDENNHIVARSFPKFFSYEQLDGKLPQGKYTVEEKLDGSLLLAFRYNDEIITATRGSFESEQAAKGKEFLSAINFAIYEGVTYVFEIIYKDNRIVVDYDYEGLVLLDIFHTNYPQKNYWINDNALNLAANYFGFRRPKIYDFKSLDEILSYNEQNIEGFVLLYSTGERVKIKTDDYKRLHRLITGVSEKTVWEALKNNTFEQLIENVPDEFYSWVQNVKLDLEIKFKDIHNSAVKDYNALDWCEARKEFALEAVKTPYPSILFKWFDGLEADQIIWNMVKPEVTKVFKMVGEDSN